MHRIHHQQLRVRGEGSLRFADVAWALVSESTGRAPNDQKVRRPIFGNINLRVGLHDLGKVAPSPTTSPSTTPHVQGCAPDLRRCVSDAHEVAAMSLDVGSERRILSGVSDARRRGKRRVRSSNLRSADERCGRHKCMSAAERACPLARHSHTQSGQGVLQGGFDRGDVGV